MDELNFIGRGWSFPVTFTNNGKSVTMSNDKANIDQNLDVLLSTEVAERLMYNDFGCGLQQFVYEEFDTTLVSKIKDAISNTILMYEPRIDLLNIEINRALNNLDTILIKMEYRVRSTNTRSNKVYPFYLREASNDE